MRSDNQTNDGRADVVAAFLIICILVAGALFWVSSQ